MSIKCVLKILIAGDGGVGKTTLLHRYIKGNFLKDTDMTMGVEFFSKKLKIGEYEIDLQLWDFGGQEQFRHLLPKYILGAHGALLLFDLTRTGTLFNLEDWVNIIRKHDPNLPILFIGSKLDIIDEIQVDDDYILELKEEFKFFDSLKVSSKTGENISDIFETITRKILEHQSF